MTNQKDFIRKPYTKTESGLRIISLDDDTIEVLKSGKLFKNHGVEQFILSYTDLPLYRSTVQRIIQRYAKLAKVP